MFDPYNQNCIFSEKITLDISCSFAVTRAYLFVLVFKESPDKVQLATLQQNYIQSNLNNSNTDGSFTMANSNSVSSQTDYLIQVVDANSHT